MNMAIIVLGAVLALAVLLVLWAVSLYNGLVVLRNRYRNAYAQIDVQLKRRYDLIPNLVETAKRYMAHERETLEAVTAARNQAAGAAAALASTPGDAGAIRTFAAAEAGLAGVLSRLMAVVERWRSFPRRRTASRSRVSTITTRLWPTICAASSSRVRSWPVRSALRRRLCSNPPRATPSAPRRR